MPERTPVNVFFCYAPQDEELRGELETHLALLKRQGYVRSWSARRIGAGAEWRGAIDQHLEEAEVILLLVSADFLASDYLYDVELTRALERKERDGVPVYAILLRPGDYAFEGSPLKKVSQVLPQNGVPVTSWSTHDAAFADVVQWLRIALDQGRAAGGRTAANPSAAHPSRASEGWARIRRCATPCPTLRSRRRGTCRTGGTPPSRGATTSSPTSTRA